MKTIIKIVRIMIDAMRKNVYMSTRISNNERLGWKIEENVKLAGWRKKENEEVWGEGEVMNPAEFYVKGWTNIEYMRMWRIVLKIMKIRKCLMVCYREDWEGSEGCKEEGTLGLRRIVI